MDDPYFEKISIKNKYFKERTAANELVYKKQNNFWSRLFEKERRKYYNNLILSEVTDNKKSWKTVEPVLPRKEKIFEKITLKDKDDTQIHSNTQIAPTLFQNSSQLACN